METREQIVKNWLNQYGDLFPDIDLPYYLLDAPDMYEIDVYSTDKLRDMIELDGAFKVDIFYYHNAMEYLKEHDASLIDSMAMAEEMGFDIADINSELLASLLATHHNRLNFEDNRNILDNLFNELEDNENSI